MSGGRQPSKPPAFPDGIGRSRSVAMQAGNMVEERGIDPDLLIANQRHPFRPCPKAGL